MFLWGWRFFLCFQHMYYRNALIPQNLPYPKKFLVVLLKFMCFLMITESEFTYFYSRCSFAIDNLINSS